MQQVITSSQARQITRGRTAMVPAEFDAAVKAVAACTQFDEAKYWTDKASALAAWAKIYHSQGISRQARILRLHAYRRMAQLAQDIQKENGKGRIRTILEEKGLSVTEARQIDGVGRATKRQFEKAIASQVPPAPWAFSRGTEAAELAYFRSMHRLVTSTTPVQFCSLITDKNEDAFRAKVKEITEWLDELDHRLGKR
jgi:2-keto-3-deoxy-galactonokinase